MTHKLRVLVFAAYYPPHRGGYERVVAELAERIVAHGHRVTVITCNLGGQPERETRNGVLVIRLPSWRLLGGTYAVPKLSLKSFALVNEATKGDIDVIHTHTRFFVTSALGLLMSLARRVPLVHTEHGSEHSSVQSLSVRVLNHICDHTVGLAIMRRARVVAVSNAAATFCRHIGARRVSVIPTGVDTHVFRRRDGGFRRQYGIRDDEVVVVFVGRLVFGKGVQDLLDAWALLPGNGMPTRLVIVGDGPLRAALEQQARPLGGYVIFTGGLDTDELVQVLSGSDIFVSPTHTEGLPLTIFEASAVGLPTVASGVGGVLDIVQHGLTGLLVPPRDPRALASALGRLVADPELRRELGARANRAVGDRFDWAKTSRAYLQIYDAVVVEGPDGFTDEDDDTQLVVGDSAGD